MRYLFQSRCNRQILNKIDTTINHPIIFCIPTGTVGFVAVQIAVSVVKAFPNPRISAPVGVNFSLNDLGCHRNIIFRMHSNMMLCQLSHTLYSQITLFVYLYLNTLYPVHAQRFVHKGCTATFRYIIIHLFET